MRRNLLIGSILVFVLLNAVIITTKASFPTRGPSVFVDPQNVVMYEGQTLTIRVRVFNLTAVWVPDPAFPTYKIPLGNLYGFDMVLTWDILYFSYVLNSAEPYVPVEWYPDGILHEPYTEVANTVTSGRYNVAEASIIDEGPPPIIPDPFNNPGNSTVFLIKFKAIKTGTTSLQLPIAELHLTDNASRRIGRDQNGDPIYLYSYSATVRIKIPGDVDGNGAVASADLSIFRQAYGSTIGQPRWNSMCNFNDDTKIDVLDLFKLGDNFGKSE